MTLVREFDLFLTAGRSLPLLINVNQFDSGEEWHFTLYKGDGTQYIPSTGAIVGIKSDGLGIINSGTVVDGKVVIVETQQMTAAVGKATFELTIDSGTHGTANFHVLVEPKPGNNADLSDSDLSLIQEALNAVSPLPTGGTVGQVLTKTAQGSAWSDAGTPTQEQVAEAVSDWADEHITVETGVVIDTSLSVAGAAADAKKTGDEISDLKSHFNEITSLTRNIAYLEQGTLNIGTGAEEASTTRCRTNFIPVTTETQLFISRYLWSARNGIGYDENKNFVASNQYLSDAFADAGRAFTVSNSSIKYVRFIYSASNTSQDVTPSYSTFMVESGAKSDQYIPYRSASDYTARDGLTVVNHRIDSLVGDTRNIAYLEQGSLDIGTGAEAVNSTRCRTNFIPVTTEDKLYISRGLWCVRNGIGYDENKNFVASNQFLLDNLADDGADFHITNSNIKYVRFIYSASDSTQDVTPAYSTFMVEKNEDSGIYVPYETAEDYEARAEIERVKRAPYNLNTLCEGIDNVAVCGDSLIVGTTLNASAVARTNANWSWVKRLAVKSGNNWVAYGRAGLTLQSWLTDSTGLPALQAGTAPEVIIISLGTNDAVGDDYLTAFETNYNTLIETLHTNYPNAIIMCLPLWNFASTRPAEYTNTAEVISALCNSHAYAYYVDMSDYDGVLKNNYFTQSRISAHYNSLAYALIADIIATCIGKVVEQNPLDFVYINFIGA